MRLVERNVKSVDPAPLPFRLSGMRWLVLWIVFIVPNGLCEQLPPGVPRVINSDGSVDVPMLFSSPAYEDAAFKLLLAEAQNIALELKLSEKQLLTQANVIQKQINPFGFSFMEKRIGTITTDKYCYAVAQSNKFSGLVINKYDSVCDALRVGKAMPISRLDTNTPFLLATEWLRAISVNVDALNRDCRASIAISPFWNGLERLGDPPQRAQFVPIYVVWWQSEQNRKEGSGSVAFVELYLPEKKILQLIVKDSRYILRAPITFTNLADLFPGVAKVDTNNISPLKVIRDAQLK